MTVTVIRRILWAAAVIALGYVTFAYWEWRPVELVIAAGVFVILIPVDMALAREERERRQSPFGPVRKFGISEDAVRGSGMGWETGYGPRSIIHRIPWWRRMYRRITAPWWLAAWMPLLLIPAGLWLAPIVHADTTQDEAYIATLDSYGVYYSTEQAAIDVAHSMCDAFDAGVSFSRVLHATTAAGFTPFEAASEIGAAIGIYCDQHADLLRPRTVIA